MDERGRHDEVERRGLLDGSLPDSFASSGLSGGRLTWDEDEARAAAQERLTATMNRLHAIGLEVTGEVGVQDPVQATRDALRGREIDEVILSTLPSGISRWLGQDVPSKLKGSIQVPVAVVTTQKQPASA